MRGLREGRREQLEGVREGEGAPGPAGEEAAQPQAVRPVGRRRRFRRREREATAGVRFERAHRTAATHH
jgi:hypothetical protein